MKRAPLTLFMKTDEFGSKAERCPRLPSVPYTIRAMLFDKMEGSLGVSPLYRTFPLLCSLLRHHCCILS